MKYRWIIYTAIVFAIAVYYFKTPDFPKNGDNAPDLVVRNIEGVEFRLSEFWSINNIALVFTSTVCRSCIDDLEKIRNGNIEFEGYDFIIISDAPILGFNYPVFVDSEKHVFSNYNVYQVPQTFLIDKSGIVVSRMIGH